MGRREARKVETERYIQAEQNLDAKIQEAQEVVKSVDKATGRLRAAMGALQLATDKANRAEASLRKKVQG